MAKPYPSREALALHEEYPIADLHNDMLLTHYLLGYDIMKRHTNRLPFSPMVNHCDIPRLKEAGFGVAGLGLVCTPLKMLAHRRFHQISFQLNYLARQCAAHPEQLRLLTDAAAMREALAAGAVACLPGIEGAQALNGRLDRLNAYHDLGARYFTLAHFSGNEACNCTMGIHRSSQRGLTDFGRRLVEAIHRRGMILDLAHTERGAFLEAAARSERPVIVSHTGLQGTCRSWRNIDDEQLEAVARTGGVVGIMIAPRFLGGAAIRPLSDYGDAVLHAVRTIGADHVAFGSDLDGWIDAMPIGFTDVTDLPLITDDLLRRGLPREDVVKIISGNVLRVIEACLN